LFKDKVLLITGGTGSFGNAVLSRFINSDIKEIRILSRDEKKQEDMRLRLNNEKIKFYIGDVRDYESVDSVIGGTDYIFHAAALKQVPSCEFYPMQAVKTNINGPNNILRAARKNSVKKAIFLSTDKAVYPINAMGLSKAMMEKLVVSESRNSNINPVFCCTRYGNVMASRGSVIPLFVSQIKAGQSITITDPNMTRFMMSLDQSVELVEYAFSNGNPGDIFVKKAPASTMITLAESLLKIFDANNPIEIIGTRHGEKLYESLLTREEMQKAEDLGDYYRVPSDNRDLNYANYFTKGEEINSEQSDYNSHNTKRLEEKELIELLMKLDYIKNELRNNEEN
tara:strand:+ start:132 stop:1151 length:1020 start_codon:yes stop_codon:yes gene_type:complete